MSERIARLLAEARMVAPLRPWPRYQVDHALFAAIGRALGTANASCSAYGRSRAWVHLALRAIAGTPCVASTAVINGDFPSIGRWHAPAIRLERTIRDLYGYNPAGAADNRPWLDHGAWEVTSPLGARAHG